MQLMQHFGQTASHLFAALDVLLEAARQHYRSPSVAQQRAEFGHAAREVSLALSDWTKARQP